MKIEIETDGYASGTKILIDGRELECVKEFKFSVAVKHKDERARWRGGFCNMQIAKENEKGEPQSLQYYKDGFGKVGEAELWKDTGFVGGELKKKEEDGHGSGEKQGVGQG